MRSFEHVHLVYGPVNLDGYNEVGIADWLKISGKFYAGLSSSQAIRLPADEAVRTLVLGEGVGLTLKEL